MKLAICLSGQPRNFQQSFISLKSHFLDKFDCDVYFHTWKVTNFESTNFGFGNNQYSLNEADYLNLINLFSPKKYSLDLPITFDASGYACPIWRQPLNNTLSMYYSIYRSIQLVGGEYDYIIRSRFDLDYSKFNLEFPQDGINIPYWNTDVRVRDRGYYDVFAIGTPESMQTYSTVFSNAISYISNDENYLRFLQGGWPGQDSPLRNEYLLKWHLTKNNITIKEIPTLEDKSDVGIIR